MIIFLCLYFLSCLHRNENLNNKPFSPRKINIKKGSIVSIPPNENIPYYWNYYIPQQSTKIDSYRIILNGSYGQGGTDVESAQIETLHQMNGWKNYFNDSSYIFLTIAIPRRNSTYHGDPWVLHFPEYVFNKKSGKLNYRPDELVNLIIDELILSIDQNGLNINKKVFVFGYSIGGHFSNRYSLLNPSRVEAFAAGGLSGELSLSFETLVDRKLLWPLGVSNYRELTGKEFKKEIYNNIPKYIFWGENDLFPYHLDEKSGDPYYNFWKKIWGVNSAEALTAQVKKSIEENNSMIYKEYQNIGHEFTGDQFRDMLVFFSQYN